VASDGASSLTAPLLSSLWYRVAALKPKLRSHARLHRHRYRGQVWYLLRDPASGRVHRFAPPTRLIISLMDGRRTVAELWEIASRHLRDHAPTQDEMIQLLGQLHATDLLQSDVTPDVAELFERGEREEKARHRRSFGNPMAIRIPLWDPERFLNRFEAPIRLIWSRWGALVWLSVVLPALFLVPLHWPELSNAFADRILALDNLVLLYFVFPILKMFHELGHATATKARGGEVHDLGLILLVLLPVPYVEASAAATFKSKYDRALVGAAGVGVELFLAALAFYVWLLMEPGLAHALLFNVMVIAGVSTLLFNGNPLLRYDAYYILADLVEIPNLSARSLRYWGYLIERYFLGAREVDAPEASRGEKAWFIFYGIGSSLYRVLVTVLIAVFIAQRFFVIGVLLALWALAAMALFPVVKGVRHLTSSPRLRKSRSRAIGTTAAALLALVGLLVVVPFPYHSQAEGVMWLADTAMVRAAANGFFDDFIARPGTHVKPGDALIRCADPAADAKLRRGEARVVELQADYMAEIAADQAKAGVVREALLGEHKALAAVRERIGDLIVRANAEGEFIVPQPEDLLGRYYRKGDVLGYVIGQTPALARVVVPQAEVDQVRLATRRILVRLVGRPEAVVRGRIVREVPAGEEYLPSRALAAEGGGQIATDPRDAKGPKALQRMFQFDVELDKTAEGEEFGQRVFVRFEHPMTPLVVQWYRSIRLLFLTSFDV
jgi:putative peptide zinc metalloprotease protein